MPDSVPSSAADFSLPELSPLNVDGAAAIFEQGKAAVVFALLALAKQLADFQTPDLNPATPSAMVPVYQKPPAKKRRNNSGARSLAG